MNEKEMHYSLYLMAEKKYIDKHKDLNENELFPGDWYLSDNYFLKNKILAEAIINNKLIKDTEKYQEFIERVITK